jgi:hypothetical protein
MVGRVIGWQSWSWNDRKGYGMAVMVMDW